MIKVGLVGVGFMGWIHYLAYQQVRGVKLRAICTRSKRKLAGDWRGIQGNFGPPGERVDVSGWQTYSQIDDFVGRSGDRPDRQLPTASFTRGGHVAGPERRASTSFAKNLWRSRLPIVARWSLLPTERESNCWWARCCPTSRNTLTPES